MRSRFLCPLLSALLLSAPLLVVLAQPAAAGEPPDRLFLQQVGPRSAIVKWRGGDADQACIARKFKDLKKKKKKVTCVDATVTAGNHNEAEFTGLKPNKEYFYILGEPGKDADTDVDQRFRTPPDKNKPPKDRNTHIWLVGDSGTETELSIFSGQPSHPGEAIEVKEGFFTYNETVGGGEPIDLFLLLGDNAYLEGTDEQWQGAFFEIYPEIANKAAVWPTIGNHEMGGGDLDLCTIIPSIPAFFCPLFIGGTSFSSDPDSFDGDLDGVPDAGGLPYLSIFSLPSGAEVGGVPSGTEQYYSFNYANVHVVSLDSQLSNRDDVQREAMADWLIADLGSNFRDWTIVIFHHPPYTKGENHDSDVEQAEIDMRETFSPIFESHGVDVVYGGHSHSYERSYYLNGHSGPSNTFDPTLHAELNEGGGPANGMGAEEYSQISGGSGVDDKAVYTVAGSSGKADEFDPCEPPTTVGCTLPDWLEHPAHFLSVPIKGSVVVDASRKELRSRFIDVNGLVLDQFTIKRR